MKYRVRLLGLKYDEKLEKLASEKYLEECNHKLFLLTFDPELDEQTKNKYRNSVKKLIRNIPKLRRNLTFIYEKDICDSYLESDDFRDYMIDEASYFEEHESEMLKYAEQFLEYKPISVRRVALDERYAEEDYEEIDEKRDYEYNFIFISARLVDYALVLFKDNEVINITEALEGKFDKQKDEIQRRFLIKSLKEYFKKTENKHHIILEGESKNAKIYTNHFNDVVIEYLEETVKKVCFVRTVSNGPKFNKLKKEMRTIPNDQKLDYFRTKTRTTDLYYFTDYYFTEDYDRKL